MPSPPTTEEKPMKSSVQISLIPVFCLAFFLSLFISSGLLAKESMDHSGMKMEGMHQHQHEEMPKDDPGVGLDEKIGSAIPLDLTFRDESGQPVTLISWSTARPSLLPSITAARMSVISCRPTWRGFCPIFAASRARNTTSCRSALMRPKPRSWPPRTAICTTRR